VISEIEKKKKTKIVSPLLFLFEISSFFFLNRELVQLKKNKISIQKEAL
jgi:hypothetical protein